MAILRTVFSVLLDATFSLSMPSNPSNSKQSSATSGAASSGKKTSATTGEKCHCGTAKCNSSDIKAEDRCLQCAYCQDFVLLRCLGSDSQAVYNFIQSCSGLVYGCPTCRAEALPSASAAGLAKVEAKVDLLVNLFVPDCPSPPGATLDTTEWPTPAEAPNDYSRKKHLKQAAIPSLTNAVELALEKREQKDCLVLSGVTDSGDEQKDMQSATDILKQLGVSSRPVKAYRMGRTGKQGQPCLLKVHLRSSHDRNQALRNTRALANSNFSRVFVRPSLTAEERTRLKALMRERWQRNSNGDYCFIDWVSLTLKTSKKSSKFSQSPNRDSGALRKSSNASLGCNASAMSGNG